MSQVFSSRWALLAATLGMAIGTGNVWRFPRILAKNGGGTFLIPWLVFLLSWSIPLLVVEFGLGRGTRRGPAGAFARAFGAKTAWRGGFVAFCTLFIMFYYSVVAGWTVRYLVLTVRTLLEPGSGLAAIEPGAPAAAAFLDFTSTWQPAAFHLLAIGTACLVVARGVQRGIERACSVLVPTLFVLLLLTAVRSVTLDGAGAGLAFLFSVDFEKLADHTVWLEALSQSAWSTGAGWGLMLCYAIYASRDARGARDSTATGFGNNAASLLAALAIIPAVFALAPASGVDAETLIGESGPANTGLTFIWVPALFARMPAGGVLSFVFFLGLAFAALSSMIAMVELGVRTLQDLGHARGRATMITFGAGLLLGLPSAVDLPFVPGHSGLAVFENQDWVWGLGLVVCGGLMSFSVIGYGARRFWDDYVLRPEGGVDTAWQRWLRFCVAWLVPVQFLGLMAWWFLLAYRWTEGVGEDGTPLGVGARLSEWLAPLSRFSVGTCLLQWGVLAGLLVLFNRRVTARLEANVDD